MLIYNKKLASTNIKENNYFLRWHTLNAQKKILFSSFSNVGKEKESYGVTAIEDSVKLSLDSIYLHYISKNTIVIQSIYLDYHPWKKIFSFLGTKVSQISDHLYYVSEIGMSILIDKTIDSKDLVFKEEEVFDCYKTRNSGQILKKYHLQQLSFTGGNYTHQVRKNDWNVIKDYLETTGLLLYISREKVYLGSYPSHNLSYLSIKPYATIEISSTEILSVFIIKSLSSNISKLLLEITCSYLTNELYLIIPDYTNPLFLTKKTHLNIAVDYPFVRTTYLFTKFENRFDFFANHDSYNDFFSVEKGNENLTATRENCTITVNTLKSKYLKEFALLKKSKPIEQVPQDRSKTVKTNLDYNTFNYYIFFFIIFLIIIAFKLTNT